MALCSTKIAKQNATYQHSCLFHEGLGTLSPNRWNRDDPVDLSALPVIILDAQLLEDSRLSSHVVVLQGSAKDDVCWQACATVCGLNHRPATYILHDEHDRHKTAKPSHVKKCLATCISVRLRWQESRPVLAENKDMEPAFQHANHFLSATSEFVEF